MRSLFVKAIWVWLAFFVLAVLNGILRDAVYVPQWGAFWGRIAGTPILCVAMLIVMYVFLRRNAGALTRVRLIGLGVLWLVLSVFFEFAVSHWVMEDPWNVILAHYSVMQGQLRVLVRLVELAGPFVLGGRFLAAPVALPAEAPAPQPPDETPPAGESGGEA
ncbi:MAG TPA: hypothetical protein VKB51_01660 [bacterium]|nr:hypothetical protein [bacterium]